MESDVSRPAAGGGAARIALAYASAAAVRGDRLPQEARGLIARAPFALRVGDAVEVSLEVRLEAVSIRARGEVRWVNALATGALVGLALTGTTPEDARRLDHLLGTGEDTVGGAGRSDAPALHSAAAPVLSVAMLQPNSVLRQILGSALARLARALGEHWSVRVDASADRAGLLADVAARRRQLAVVDCDAAAGDAAALVRAIRAREGCDRLPIVLLSERRAAGIEDRWAVTLQKPITVKAFLHTAALLLRA